jgi:ATP-dependent DNA helicase RecG
MRVKTETLLISLDKEIELCEKEESHFFEKKSSRIKPNSLLKHVVALANSDGGELLIGVKDDREENNSSLRWEGLPSIENYNGVFQCISELDPSVDYSATFLKSTSRQTYGLRLTIEKSHLVHTTLDGSVYIRNSAQTSILKSHKKIQELAFQKGEKSFEDSIIKNAYTEDITDSNAIDFFLKEYSPSSDKLEFITKSNLINRHTLEPRVSGILLFSDLPSDSMPTKCSVKVIRYTTSELAPSREHLNEISTIEGALYPLINNVMNCIQSMTKDIKLWNKKGELKEVVYPYEAIWEIMVNSIIHRDYSVSDDTQILIFDNRIEFVSPGKLPGRVTVNNILKISFARNSKIVKFLNRYKEPPNKDIGEGLRTAFQKMSDLNLSEPEIKEENNYVKVILRHEPIASPTEIVLKHLEKNTTITNRELRELTGIRSESKALNIFRKLSEKNMIERVKGLAGKASAWKLKRKN